MFPPGPDFSKRDYLLPQGCHDLTDIPHLSSLAHRRGPPPPPRIVSLGATQSARQLSILLHLTLFQVILDVIRISGFCSLGQAIPTEVAAEVARRHGIVPRVRSTGEC